MRPRRTEAQWRETWEAYNKSGLTKAEFCEREDISDSTFGEWIRKIRESNRQAFLREAGAGEEVPSGGFVELCLPGSGLRPSVSDSDADVVVELPLGVVLRFRGIR